MSQNSTDKSRGIVDRSPKGRYIRYNDVVGRGAYKVVYRGYDTHSGIEVAWNLIRFDVLADGERELIIEEVKLLKQLSTSRNHIIKFHNAWIDKEKGDLIVITELALSGTLKDYILKINNINLRVIKKWCNQILEGIDFLHQQNIAHRDLKCNNIFINSNTGNIIIGDLGLAKQRGTNFHSVIGTPQYMAPEMYEGEYDEKVDIYAFGMCFLEMITKKVPYCECGGIGAVYKKVAAGGVPDCITQIKNLEAKSIISKCIDFDPKKRPSAKDLLENTFFHIIKQEDNDENLMHDVLEGYPISPQTFYKKKTPKSPITQVNMVVAAEESIDPPRTVVPVVADTKSNPTMNLLSDITLSKGKRIGPSLISFEEDHETVEFNVTEETINILDSANSANSANFANFANDYPIGSSEETEDFDHITHITQLMDSNLKKFCETSNKKILNAIVEMKESNNNDVDDVTTEEPE